jgi:hypothetical protein
MRPPSINGYTPLWIKDEETAALAAKKLQVSAAGGTGGSGGKKPAALLKALAKRATGTNEEAEADDADYAGEIAAGDKAGPAAGLLSLLKPLTQGGATTDGSNLRTAAPADAAAPSTAADGSAGVGAAAVAKGLASVLGLPTALPEGGALPTLPAAKQAAKQAFQEVLASVDLSKVDLNDVQGSLQRLSGGVLSGLDAALAGAGQSATGYVSQLSSNMKPPKLAISGVEVTRFAVYGWNVEQALAGVVEGRGGLAKPAGGEASAERPRVAAAMVAAAAEGEAPLPEGEEGQMVEWEMVEEEGGGDSYSMAGAPDRGAGALTATATTTAEIDGAAAEAAEPEAGPGEVVYEEVVEEQEVEDDGGKEAVATSPAPHNTTTSTQNTSQLREDATSARTVFDSAAVVGRKVVVSRHEKRAWWRVRGTVTLSNVNIVPLVVSGLAVTVAAGEGLGDAAPPATLAAAAAMSGGGRGAARVARVAASCPSASEKSDAVLIPGTPLSSLMPGKLECTFEVTLPGDTPADARGKVTAALNVALLPALSGQAAPAVPFSLAGAAVEERGACATVTDTYFSDASSAARALRSSAGTGAAGEAAAEQALSGVPQLRPSSVAAGDKPPSEDDGAATPTRVCGPDPTTFLYAVAYGPYDNAACGSYGSTNVVRVVPEGGAGGGGGSGGLLAGLLGGLSGGAATADAAAAADPSSATATNPLASGLAGLLGLATAQGVGGGGASGLSTGSAKEGGGEFVGGSGGAFGTGPQSQPTGGVSSATLPVEVTGCLPVTVASLTPRTIKKYSWDVQQQAAPLLGSGGKGLGLAGLFGGLSGGGATSNAPASAFWAAPGISLPLGYTVRFTRAADERHVLTGTVVLSNPTSRPLTVKAATVTAGPAAAEAAATAAADASSSSSWSSGGRTAADLLAGCARAENDASSALVVVPPATMLGGAMTPGTLECSFKLELPQGGVGNVQANVDYGASDPLGARAAGGAARSAKPLAYDFDRGVVATSGDQDSVSTPAATVIEVGKCADVRVAFDKGYGGGELSSAMLVAPRALSGALPPGLSADGSGGASSSGSSSSSSRPARVCAPTSYSFRATFSPLPGGCGSARAARMVATAAPLAGGATVAGQPSQSPAAAKAAAIAAAKQAVRRALPIGVTVAGGDCGPVVASAAASAAENAAATVAAIGRRVVVASHRPRLPTAVDPTSGLRLAAGSPLAQEATERDEEEALLLELLMNGEEEGEGDEEVFVDEAVEEEWVGGGGSGAEGAVVEARSSLFAAEVEGPQEQQQQQQAQTLAAAPPASPVTVTVASLTPGVIAAAYSWTVEAGTVAAPGSSSAVGGGAGGGELSVSPGGSAALTRAVVVRRSEQAEAVSPTGAAGYALSGVVEVSNPSLSPLPPLRRVVASVWRPSPGGPEPGRRALRAVEVPTTCAPGTVVPPGQVLKCSFALAYPDTIPSRVVGTAEFLTEAGGAGARGAAAAPLLPGATVVPSAVRSAPAKFAFSPSSGPLRAVIAGECASLTDDLSLAAPAGIAAAESAADALVTVLDDGQGVAAVKAPAAAAVASGAAAPLRLCGSGDRRFRYQVLLGPLGGAGRCFGVGEEGQEEAEPAYVLKGRAVASPLVAGAAAAVPSTALRSAVAAAGRGQTAAVSADSELVVRLAGC